MTSLQNTHTDSRVLFRSRAAKFKLRMVVLYQLTRSRTWCFWWLWFVSFYMLRLSDQCPLKYILCVTRRSTKCKAAWIECWRVQSRHGCLWNKVAKSTPSLASTRIYDGHGSFVPRMMHAVDWYPTILKLAGLQPGKCIDVAAHRSCVWSLARWRHWGGGGGGSCLLSAVRVVNVHGSGCTVSEKAPDTDDMLLATSCKDKYSLHTHAVLDCTSLHHRERARDFSKVPE